MLVWLAMSKCGVSEIFTCPSGLAINQEIYRVECLKRRLIPFIKKYHSQDEIIFWPDLATSHYAESVCDFMIEENIPFVEKYENPANIPECRSVERFWAILKSKVYEDNWEAKNLKELEKRIRFCLKNIDTNALAKLFNGIPSKLAFIGWHGVNGRE